jgi:cellulose synthase/poly-beta-1,6-N-acetylglucosamine synthase-like glycosyltransferase
LPTALPPDAERAWTCEIRWEYAGRHGQFRAIAENREDGRQVLVASSARLALPLVEWSSLAAMMAAAGQLERRLLAAGWGAIEPGPAWYAKRFAWTPVLPAATTVPRAVDAVVASAPSASLGRRMAQRARSRLPASDMPFRHAGKSVLVGLMSIATIVVIVVYALLSAPGLACGSGCTPAPAVQSAYNLAASVTLVISLYFLGLNLVGLLRTRRGPTRAAAASPLFVIVTPAHNEELVIGETVRRLLTLDAEHYLAVVMNDGSRDRTSEVAREAGDGDPRLIVVDRPHEIAGQGKGEVLNHAYRLLVQMVEEDDPRLRGASTEQIVMGVLDADGWLRQDCLSAVAPYYDDPEVAGVQVPVRMWNARDGFLACMQDIEFVGFSVLVQGGRDVIGSVGLGGNGQFIRVSALETLGSAPWTKCLTEDLDIGLSLVKRGWRHRMCPDTCVAQQAVTKSRVLLRQRTRWTQGHYSCWSHLPGLWRTREIPWLTRLDLSLHLLLALTIVVVAVQAVIGLLGFFAIYPIHRSVIATVLPGESVYRLFVLLMACGPLSFLGIAYQRSAIAYDSYGRSRLPLWSLPGMFLAFTLYTYFWGVPSTVRAFARILLRRDAWAKTPRDAVAAQELTAPVLVRH